MGMFDTVLVAKNLLDEVIKDSDIILEASSDGYYDFQTKDLDNFLTTFFLSVFDPLYSFLAEPVLSEI